MNIARLLLTALGVFAVLATPTVCGQGIPAQSTDIDASRSIGKLASAVTVLEPYTFTTLAGSAGAQGSTDSAGSAARFFSPYAVTVDSAGNVYVADTRNHTIRKITVTGTTTTLAGAALRGGIADGTGSAAQFNQPWGIAVDSAGNVYVADRYNHTIRKVTPAGVVTTLAGLVARRGSADGTGSAARFDQPWGVAVDGAGNVYVADYFNHTIRKVTPAGVVTTLAGRTGIIGSADGTGSAAQFNYPSGVAVDTAGNLFVADEGNHTIRKVTTTGTVTTFAGLAGNRGSADGTGSAARFWNPYGIAVDGVGNLYVADTWNETIRKATPAGAVTTLGGLADNPGSADGTGSAARFDHPTGVAVDRAGKLYVADSNNHTIRGGVPTVVAPIITMQPQSQTNNIGATATFTVIAAGSAPLTYQWRFNGANITGATGSLLTVTDIQRDDQGTYTVIVSNAAGSVPSQPAELAVIAPNTPPTISHIPDQVTNRNTPTSQIVFTIADAETPVEKLLVSVTSSNESLLPNGNIFLGSGPTGRTLILLPAPNQSGATTITVTVIDADGSSVRSQFLLTVSSPNSPPTLNVMSNLVVPEDAAAQTVNLSGLTSGAPNENQVLAITATSSNPALVANPAVNYASPSSTGTLSIQPASDASGQAIISVTVRDNGGTADGAIDAVTRAFLVTVTPVNDAPSFFKSADQNVNEDSGAQTVTGWAKSPSPGPPNESSQTLSFQILNDNNSLFAVPPALTANGTLSFTPSANASGTATVTVILKDHGGTANGGIDASPPQTFTITVAPVNDAPTLAPVNSVTINDDARARMINLTGISAGGGENQSLTLRATSNNPNLLPHPTVNYSSPAATGTLTFAPVNNAHGSALVTVIVTDDGGTENGGVNAVTNIFSVTINSVNDAPSFTRGPDQAVAEDSVGQSIANWASNLSAGPPDEASQTLVFQVSSDNNGLFSVPPAISPSGTLSFTPRANASGAATVTVILKDDGGTANGGVDASPPQTFKIAVAPVNDVPTLAPLSSVTINEDASAQTIDLTGISPGGGENQSLTLRATSNNPNLLPHPTVIYSSPAATGTLTFAPVNNAHGSALVTMILTDDGGTENGGVNAVTNTFSVTVNSVNDPPTLAAIGDLTIIENAPPQIVSLPGISAGPPNERQAIVITAASDKPLLVGDPTVNYLNPNTAGTLTLRPVPGASGIATITVTVKDDSGALNGGADTITRSFRVTVAELPELHVNSISVNEGQSGLTETLFEVELRGANSLPVAVHFATADGTATSGSDYQSLSGRLEFLPEDGGSPKLNIHRGGDQVEIRWMTTVNLWELFETDNVSLTEWSKSSRPVAVRGIEHSVAVSLSDRTRFFRLVSTTAASAGTTLQQVRVLVVGDQVAEPGENFFLRLSEPVNAIIVQGSGEAIIRNDDEELPNTPPQVSIRSPETDDTFPEGSNIVIAAEASDVDGFV
ncbi:MAG: Ig-like domain-containing protein, partial [Verrucomicrobiales bacterium]|nr:Ig-like domain-containing protein [Verrucomicrobiales bacterium]